MLIIFDLIIAPFFHNFALDFVVDMIEVMKEFGPLLE